MSSRLGHQQGCGAKLRSRALWSRVSAMEQRCRAVLRGRWSRDVEQGQRRGAVLRGAGLWSRDVEQEQGCGAGL